MDVAAQAFERAALSLVEDGVRVLIMGCTEIPLALDAARLPVSVQLVDAAQVLAQRLAAWAYGED
jgi:aspartate racemase